MHQTAAELKQVILRSSGYTWLIVICFLSLPLLSIAQDETPTATTADVIDDETTPPADESKPESNDESQDSLNSPRQMLRTFLNAIQAKDLDIAATALDFSDIDPLPDTAQQHEAVTQLKAIIDQMPIVDVEKISDAQDSPPTTFPPQEKDSPLVIIRSDDDKWRFSPKTVSKLASLYKLYVDPPIDAPTQTPEPPIAEPLVTPTTPTTKSPTDPTPATISEPSPTPVPVVSEHLRSARRALRTLMDGISNRDYQQAVTALDFSKLDPDMGPYAQLEIARQLKDIIDRLAPVDYSVISDDPAGPTCPFPPGQSETVVMISRDKTGTWRFSADTVAKVPELHSIYKDRPIVNLAKDEKPWLYRELFLGNEAWRIMFVIACILLSIVIGQILRSTLNALTRYREKHKRAVSAIVAKMLASTARPFCLLLGLRIGLDQLILIDSVEKTADSLIKVVFLVVIGYVLFRLVDVIVEWLQQLAISSGSTLNDMLVPIVRTSLRLAVVVVVLVQIVMELSNQPPSTILAGLGAGGLAIGLAAQDTIKNVFGSLMIYVDRPFELGDRILIDGHDGPVESVGFRSTRIRTLEGHLVTIPNGEMANRILQNIGQRPFIRRVMEIRIPYETPREKLSEALTILRNLLSDHEGMRETHPPRVFLDEFKESSISIRVMYWYHPPEYWNYCEYGEKLNLQIVERFAEANIEFALPTKRLFVSNE